MLVLFFVLHLSFPKKTETLVSTLFLHFLKTSNSFGFTLYFS